MCWPLTYLEENGGRARAAWLPLRTDPLIKFSPRSQGLPWNVKNRRSVLAFAPFPWQNKVRVMGPVAASAHGSKACFTSQMVQNMALAPRTCPEASDRGLSVTSSSRLPFLMSLSYELLSMKRETAGGRAGSMWERPILSHACPMPLMPAVS